ncbi:flagellar motor protein MotB [Enterobacter cancerogenus]|uniref:Flagellar motor protein MotB n=1 Tax=Enterobacter cancerogenus TaxID=69218 RepID=A0A484Y780_9ENTR|nr:flagellar motor protein MotB [Enterobacter cancerogenus]
MITPQQKGEVKKRAEHRRAEKTDGAGAALKKVRGDLDQLIEADPKLRALRPHPED